MSPGPPGMVFLLRCLDYGGAERQAVNLARGLKERGWPVTVLVFYAGGPLQPSLEEAGVPVIGLDKRGRWDLAGFAGKLLAHLRRLRPRLLHTYLDVPNVLGAMIKPLLPGLKLVWGVRASNMDLARYDRLSRLAFSLARRLSPAADLIIANSRAGRDYHLGRGYRPGRFLVIPNGVDTGRFRPRPRAGAALRRQWGVATGQRLLGLVGRLDPMKDHATFLRAAARLREDFPDLGLVCVGPAPAPRLRPLQELAGRLGLREHLTWAGAQRDMSAVYSALDLLVSSSAFGEGFSNAVSEAMACATPAVVTRVGDSAAIVGQPALAAPPGHWRALARRCRTVLELPPHQYRRLCQMMRRRILENYTCRHLLERTEGVLVQLLEAGS